MVGTSVNYVGPSFASDRPATPSSSARHRYFNRAPVIAKSQLVTAILEPSIKKTVYMGNSSQFYSFRNSLGHFTQKTINSYTRNNITAPPPASPPQTSPCNWGTLTETYSSWGTPASGSWRWPRRPEDVAGCREHPLHGSGARDGGAILDEQVFPLLPMLHGEEGPGEGFPSGLPVQDAGPQHHIM